MRRRKGLGEEMGFKLSMKDTVRQIESRAGVGAWG